MSLLFLQWLMAFTDDNAFYNNPFFNSNALTFGSTKCIQLFLQKNTKHPLGINHLSITYNSGDQTQIYYP